MRIGQLTEVYKPLINGVTNFISLHKRVLESWGHKVFVFTLGHEDYEDEELHVIRSPALPLSDTGYYLSFRFSRRARRKIKTLDVLHVHHPFISGRQAINLGKRYNIPVVFTNHTRYHLQATYYVPFVTDGLSHAFFEAYLPSFTDKCDLVVAPSPGVKESLEDLGVTCHIDVIPNGIEVPHFQHPTSPFAKSHLGISEQATVAITVSRLGPEKNLGFLLRSFTRLLDLEPNLHLVVIGDGPDEESLKETAYLFGLSSHVHWIGEVPYEDIPNWLAMGDFFVITSVNESHPLVVLEALAAGLPVLGIPSPGINGTVIDGVNGLISPENTDAFATQMRRLTAQPELRTRLVAGARELSDQYDIHHTSAELLTRYKQLVKDQSK